MQKKFSKALKLFPIIPLMISLSILLKYNNTSHPSPPITIPSIKMPFKSIPKNIGGTKIQHLDKEIYNNISSSGNTKNFASNDLFIKISHFKSKRSANNFWKKKTHQLDTTLPPSIKYSVLKSDKLFHIVMGPLPSSTNIEYICNILKENENDLYCAKQ